MPSQYSRDISMDLVLLFIPSCFRPYIYVLWHFIQRNVSFRMQYLVPVPEGEIFVGLFLKAK